MYAGMPALVMAARAECALTIVYGLLPQVERAPDFDGRS